MNGDYYIPVPTDRAPEFTFVAVFRESTEFVRNYTLPFNMIGIVSRAEGARSSVMRNLRTCEMHEAHLNDIHFIPCGLAQEYRHTLRNEHLAIHFKLELYPGVDVFSGIDHCTEWNSEAWTREAREIFALTDPVLKLLRCQEFALRICRLCWPEKYPFDLERMRRFDPILQFIRRRADARTRVSELARLAHRSESAFTRAFSDLFRRTPKTFLQEEMFRRAAMLLLAPDASVKSVADRLNFSSEFNFSRFFKRMSGISPQDYARARACGRPEKR